MAKQRWGRHSIIYLFIYYLRQEDCVLGLVD